ncbi:MAG: putative baseplate assembly protein [Betaproteobacteria bacterium]|nr:putative baseplate assembly protein [Betaproteobacteria bacterium]MDH3435930.1 putative baseplate assembly protein [Betaproteobacteria bacterium]
MILPCDCCEGPAILTPLATANRPGLSQLRYRVGTHATFFETMQARLSGVAFPELAALKTREKSDPSIALLDAWATVGDVLTFYQERIANEGYLRTATERRSVLELARLIGYALRPGVSASVYLAYSIEKDSDPVEIPKGARSNSIPGPGEQMQAFETAEPLMARYEWNELKPRLTQPQTVESIAKNGLYLKGTATKLKANDPLLLDVGLGSGPVFVRVAKVELDSDNDRTHVLLRRLNALGKAVDGVKAVLAQYRAVERFDVSADAAMTKRVMAALTETEALAERDPQALAEHIRATTLPRLERELQTAREGRFTKLEPWVEALHGELQTAVKRLEAAERTAEPMAAIAIGTAKDEVRILGGVAKALSIAPSVPPPSAKQLTRNVELAFATKADTVPRLLAVLQPPLQKVFYTAWKNLPPPLTSQITVHALRVSAAPFGHNAPLRQTGLINNRPVFEEWHIEDPWNQPRKGTEPVILSVPAPGGPVGAAAPAPTPDFHKPEELYLDNDYDMAPDSMLVIEKRDGSTLIVNKADGMVHQSLAAYGMSGKTVQVNLPASGKWIAGAPDEPFATVRTTRIYAGSEKLELAEEPMTDDVAADKIELGDLYEDLEPGRWAIVSGERTDVPDAAGEPVAGVNAAELAMLAAAEQKLRTDANDVPLAGDKIHTFVTLAKPLAYKYKRATVKIYGNVVKATNGETRQETMGSGDAAKALQEFTLKQPPLTYVSAPTVSGVEGTLEVRVNDVKWHEADSLVTLAPNDTKFITRTNDDAKTTIVFGNGEQGARLPTGQENVKATYRNGIGKPGNVKAGQITLLNTRPLGAKEITNPIRASGGADKETRDQARNNAPLAVMALDRLVSTQDYADFARTFGGVGKAAAARLTDGRRHLVCVTIAGADDIPVETTSDLYRNLYATLRRFGDPYLPIQLQVRERLALVVSANVRIHPDYLWDAVESKIRTAMLDVFGFEKLELGDDLLLSNAIKVIQGVIGVTYVDVDVFDTISEAELLKGFDAPSAANLELNDRILIEPARVVFESLPGSPRKVAAAQLAYLAPEVPDTLILQELKP